MDIDAQVVAAAQANYPDQTEALLAVLQSVEDGGMTADRPAAVVMVRRLEGALLALAAMR